MLVGALVLPWLLVLEPGDSGAPLLLLLLLRPLLALLLLLEVALGDPGAVLVLLLLLPPPLLLLLLLPLPLLALLRSRTVSFVHRRGFLKILNCLTWRYYFTAYTCEENLVCSCAKYRLMRFERRSSSSTEPGEPATVRQV